MKCFFAPDVFEPDNSLRRWQICLYIYSYILAREMKIFGSVHILFCLMVDRVGCVLYFSQIRWNGHKDEEQSQLIQRLSITQMVERSGCFNRLSVVIVFSMLH